jgi:hypothetical protein
VSESAGDTKLIEGFVGIHAQSPRGEQRRRKGRRTRKPSTVMVNPPQRIHSNWQLACHAGLASEFVVVTTQQTLLLLPVHYRSW